MKMAQVGDDMVGLRLGHLSLVAVVPFAIASID